MEIVDEIELRPFKNVKYEPELLRELEIYAKTNGDRLDEFDVPIMGDEAESKLIDAILKRGDFVYIIEAKPKLNYEAIGQVVVYKHLYQKKHLKEKLKKGIVCKEPLDKDLLFFCSENDIAIFALSKNGINEIKPNEN